MLSAEYLPTVTYIKQAHMLIQPHFICSVFLKGLAKVSHFIYSVDKYVENIYKYHNP